MCQFSNSVLKLIIDSYIYHQISSFLYNITETHQPCHEGIADHGSSTFKAGQEIKKTNHSVTSLVSSPSGGVVQTY
jgi:hypothetical protein